VLSASRLTRETLSARAYAVLLEAIVRGELAPGERLRDHDLAAQLGVSRTPVREALRRLEDEGLVEAVPGVASRVAPLDAAALQQAFPVVAALHALAARLGTGALGPAELAEMEAATEARHRALACRDVVAAIAADDRFHDVLVRASGNTELATCLARVMPKIRRLDVLRFGQLAAGDGPDEHVAILDACRRGAAAEAAELVERSFLALGEHVAEILGGAG
jgi:DNA-binding GntR family transcriptional regulator